MYCFLLFTLLSNLRSIFIDVEAVAIQLSPLESRENLEDALSDDPSFWKDEIDLASVPECNGPQSSLDLEDLFDLENFFSSSNIEYNGPLIGRELEEFSTQLNNFAAPLKTLSNPACVNQDFQFRTPPNGNTDTDESGKSTGQQNQNQAPQTPLEDLLSPPQLELEPTCPKDPPYGFVEDLCCAAGPFGIYYTFCIRCKLFTFILDQGPQNRCTDSITKLTTVCRLDSPTNLICEFNRLCCREYNQRVSFSV